MMDRALDFGSLKKRAETTTSSSSSTRDRVSAYQEVNKIKKGLPKSLIKEFEKRKVTNLEEAAKVAQAVRARRTKCHKIAKSDQSKKVKTKKVAKPGELSRVGGSAAQKAIAAMKHALDSGIVKL